MDFPDLLRTVLPYLRPAEQAVYLRLWHLAGGQGTCSVCYDDLCKSAHVSTSTLKRTLKTLTQKKLLTVTFQAKAATRFQVWERPLTPKGQPALGFTAPKLYDSLLPTTAASSFPASVRSPRPHSNPWTTKPAATRTNSTSSLCAKSSVPTANRSTPISP